jgi:hypothetical protein
LGKGNTAGSPDKELAQQLILSDRSAQGAKMNRLARTTAAAAGSGRRTEKSARPGGRKARPPPQKRPRVQDGNHWSRYSWLPAKHRRSLGQKLPGDAGFARQFLKVGLNLVFRGFVHQQDHVNFLESRAAILRRRASSVFNSASCTSRFS